MHAHIYIYILYIYIQYAYIHIRGIGSFFMVMELSKNVGHHGWPTAKN